MRAYLSHAPQFLLYRNTEATRFCHLTQHQLRASLKPCPGFTATQSCERPCGCAVQNGFVSSPGSKLEKCIGPSTERWRGESSQRKTIIY